MTNVVPGFSHMNRRAWCGLIAQRISGFPAMCTTPSNASTANQISVIGPKNFPIPPVPRFCTKNSTNKMIRVSGITAFLKLGEITSKPSTADKTEMAGVMTPSP
jgi:hypothetical protein